MADSYSGLERKFLGPVRAFLQQAYAPLIRLLVAVHVAPNTVSLSGPVLGLLFLYTVRHNLRLSLLVWLLSVVVDGIDGALARSTGRASEFGALVDQVADHTRETLIVVGLAGSGALSPVWGSLYPFVYTALNVTLLLANRYAVPAPFVIKSWMTLYPTIAVYLMGGPNWLDTGAMLSVFAMTLTVLHTLRRLSGPMGSPSGG